MNYKIRIARGVYWVPAKMLGENRYSKEELERIAKLPAKQMKQKIHNLDEAIRVFDICRYKYIKNTRNVIVQGLEWECHPPKDIFTYMGGGDCASATAWLYYVLEGCYDSIMSFLIFRENNSGHVLSIIEQDSLYYFVDMFLHLDEYQAYLCQETGKLIDYAKQTYITSVIYVAEKIDYFVDFYSKVMRNIIKEHIFFVLEPGIIPPIASSVDSKEIVVYLPKSKVLKVYNKSLHIKWNGEIEPDIYYRKEEKRTNAME